MEAAGRPSMEDAGVSAGGVIEASCRYSVSETEAPGAPGTGAFQL